MGMGEWGGGGMGGVGRRSVKQVNLHKCALGLNSFCFVFNESIPIYNNTSSFLNGDGGSGVGVGMGWGWRGGGVGGRSVKQVNLYKCTLASSRGTSHASAVSAPLPWIFKNAL